MRPLPQRPPLSGGSMHLMESMSNRRRKRRVPPRFAGGAPSALSTRQVRVIVALLMVLVVCILIEVFLVDSVFFRGGSSSMTSLSDAPFAKKKKSVMSVDSALRGNQRLQEQAFGADGAATIVGLDTCRRYRNTLGNTLEDGDEPVMTLVTLFQKRAKAFTQLMRKNCKLPEEDSETNMIYNADMEDHFPLRQFPTTVLPVVLLQDPLPWMMDVCKDRPKELELEDNNSKKCPAVEDPVRVRYLEFHNATTHQSLAHLWNDWYTPWLHHHSGPRLLIRAEDITLHPEEVVTSVCHCMGGVIRDHFRNKAPSHLDSTLPKRLEGYDEDTLMTAKDQLDVDLMSAMGYTLSNSDLSTW